MPTTINGVGTRYYGKRNRQDRVGICRSCGRNVTLSSYDTRLWFVVLFIPIIPLGRKHIIDSCPSCRRHFVADREKWDAAKQLETSGTLEQFRSNPTPGNAILAHRRLVDFHQHPEAAELQRTMEEKFSDDVQVLVYLAAANSYLGKAEESYRLYQRALDLRPDLPEAKVGVAEAMLRASRLDHARGLLNFLEKPGAAQLYSLVPLEHLANAYQKAGQHEAALELFNVILQGLPAVAQNPSFRKRINTSEKALRRTTTILPKAKFSFRRFFSRSQPGLRVGAGFEISGKQALLIFSVFALLIIGGCGISNAYISHHRTLYIVNGTGGFLTVNIAGAGEFRVNSGVTPVTLPECHYVAKFTPGLPEIPFDVQSKYMDRWLRKPAWILNPGSRGIVISSRIVYAKNPTPGTFSCLFGQPFFSLREIDYPFTTPPTQIQMQSGEQQHLADALQYFQGQPINLVRELAATQRVSEACDLAEWFLREHPDDLTMLTAYIELGLANPGRVEPFLRNGLSVRPVVIEWHRQYQNLLLAQRKPGLLEEYDRMLAADPGSSALLYLRGRIGTNHAEDQDYFRRSLRADTANPYPAFALAYDATSLADWATAKQLLDPVIKLKSDNPEFTALWVEACLGLNALTEGEEVLRNHLAAEPTDLATVLNLCQLLLVDRKESELQGTIAAYQRSVAAHYQGNGRPLIEALDQQMSYMRGDFAGLERLARADESKRSRDILFAALVEQNKLSDAEKLRPMTDPTLSPHELLAVSLAWRLAGNAAEAAKWQNRAVVVLRAGADPGHLADLLSGQRLPTPENLRDLDLAAPTRAVFLANLAWIYPNQQAELNGEARRLNVERVFPYYLVRRAVAETP